MKSTILCALYLVASVHGFIPMLLRSPPRLEALAADDHETASRRSMLSATIASGAAIAFAPAATFASGGATAGGAYLLRAKQRYSARVSKGAEAYMGLGDAVAGGKLAAAPFFAGDKNSPAEDFLGASFLLANAFRINSTTSPDSLPTVKKFKAFMKEYETTLALAKKKNNADAAVASYNGSVDLLKVYLTSVEL
jgi:glutathione S-transferase